MHRRDLSRSARMLVIGQIVMACSLSPDITEADKPPVTGPPPTEAVPETDSAVATEGRPDEEKPYPLAGNSMIRHRLHWFVPQPE